MKALSTNYFHNNIILQKILTYYLNFSILIGTLKSSLIVDITPILVHTIYEISRTNEELIKRPIKCFHLIGFLINS